MKNQTKNILIVVVILLIIVLVVWVSKSRKVMSPKEEIQLDTTASINQELNSINIDSGADNELKTIDNDLNTL